MESQVAIVDRPSHPYTLSFRKDCLDYMDKLTAEGHIMQLKLLSCSMYLAPTW